MALGFGLITGLMFGIEHISGDEEDAFYWVINIVLGVFNITLINFKPE